MGQENRTSLNQLEQMQKRKSDGRTGYREQRKQRLTRNSETSEAKNLENDNGSSRKRTSTFKDDNSKRPSSRHERERFRQQRVSQQDKDISSDLNSLDDLDIPDQPGAVRVIGIGIEQEDSIEIQMDVRNVGTLKPASSASWVSKEAFKQKGQTQDLERPETAVVAQLAIDKDEEFKKQVEKEAQDKFFEDLTPAEIYEGKDLDDAIRKRFYQRLIGVMIVVTLGIVLGVVLSGGNDDNTENTTAPPTLAPVDPSFSRDLCTEALEIQTSQTVIGTNSEATADDSVDTCGSIRTNGLGVWYFMEGTGQTVAVSTCTETDFDTQISVYEGDNCFDLRCVNGNDQRSSCGQNGSHLTFFAAEGRRYYFLIHGNRNSNGIFTMEMDVQVQNSMCSSALRFEDTESEVLSEVTLFGTTRFFPPPSADPSVPMCGEIPITAPGAWYVFQARSTRFVQVQVDDFESRVNIYTGGCNDIAALTCVAASEANFVMWTTNAGEDYYVFVHGVGNNVGDYSLSLLPGGLLEPDPGTPNIECGLALPLISSPQDPFVAKSNASTREGLIADVPPCGNLVVSTANGLWYSVVGTGNAMIASTCNNWENAVLTNFDTQISVFTGDCDNLQCVDGGDQNCGDQSAVAWYAEVETPYFILVHGNEGREGEFSLLVEEFSPLSNDDCKEAVDVVLDGVTILGTTAGASFQNVGACRGPEATAASVWYKIAGTGRTLLASTKLSDEMARIELYEGFCGALSCVTEVNSDNIEQDTIIWTSEIEKVYYLQVFGSGKFSLSVDEIEDNYSCTGAADVMTVGSVVLGHTKLTRTSEDMLGPSCRSDARGNWYKFVSTSSERITASICSPRTTFDAFVQVFESPEGFQCNFDSCLANNGESCGAGSAVTWDSVAGSVYYILVQGARNDELGNFELQVGRENSFCENADPFFIGETITGFTLEATPEVVDLTCPEFSMALEGASVWYQVTGTDSIVTVTTCESWTTLDTTIFVFTGDTCDELTCVVANDDDCGLQSTASWFAEAGVNYYVAVTGVEPGDFSLTLTEIVNDSPQNALSLDHGGEPTPGIVPTGLPLEGFVDPCDGVSATLPGSWYTVVGTGGEVTVDICGDNGSEDTIAQLSVLEFANPTPFACVASTQADCSLTFNSISGVYYQVIVSGQPGTPFEVSVRSSNDLCQSPFGPLVVGDTIQGSTVGATFDDVEHCVHNWSQQGVGVWYYFIGDGLPCTVFTCSEFTDFDTEISIYYGEDCSNLVCFGSNDNGCGRSSWITVPTEEGMLYRILVTGIGNSTGNFVLSLR